MHSDQLDVHCELLRERSIRDVAVLEEHFICSFEICFTDTTISGPRISNYFRRLVLGCIETEFCKSFFNVFDIYEFCALMHRAN